MKKVVLSADSTCDLGEELIEQYGIQIQPLHIILDNADYQDGVDITVDTIFDTYVNKGILPKTASPNIGEYTEHFKKWTDQGYEVVHISLGSSISSSYHHSCLAAEEVGNVYTIDSGNLSTGMGMLVLEAAERIEKGLSAEQIQAEVTALKEKVNTSFVVDKLTYLHEGGRCSAVEAFSANLLNIKVSIEVDNTSGKMTVGKKYRGNLEKVLKHYAKARLNNADSIDYSRLIITYSGPSTAHAEMVQDLIEASHDFKEVILARAGCTISSHCGPNTIGLMFMEK